MEKEKEGTADNEGLTDLILDEEAMIDLIERYEKDDDWNSYFFRLDEIVRNIITREMAQYKTSLLDRVEAELPTFRFYCRYYSDLTDDMVGCIANENGHCNNDECKAIAEVKDAISKIRGEEK